MATEEPETNVASGELLEEREGEFADQCEDDTQEAAAAEDETNETALAADESVEASKTPKKRGRGRPPGSGSRWKIPNGVSMVANGGAKASRRWQRGSSLPDRKKKKKYDGYVSSEEEVQVPQDDEEEDFSPPKKRRGRPPMKPKLGKLGIRFGAKKPSSENISSSPSVSSSRSNEALWASWIKQDMILKRKQKELIEAQTEVYLMKIQKVKLEIKELQE